MFCVSLGFFIIVYSSIGVCLSVPLGVQEIENGQNGEFFERVGPTEYQRFGILDKLGAVLTKVLDDALGQVFLKLARGINIAFSSDRQENEIGCCGSPDYATNPEFEVYPDFKRSKTHKGSKAYFFKPPNNKRAFIFQVQDIEINERVNAADGLVTEASVKHQEQPADQNQNREVTTEEPGNEEIHQDSPSFRAGYGFLPHSHIADNY